MPENPSWLRRFLATETAGSVVLVGATAAAVAWANSPWGHGYDSLWHRRIGTRDLRHWVNDGLMALFFLVVGLEMKRELVLGRLRVWRRAVVPVVAAAAGMAAPALVYTAFNHGHPGGRGWGIPMATDIAFAVGALGLLGRRVPPGVRLFLLALAVADDIATVVVLAVFYSAHIDGPALAAAALITAGMVALRVVRVRAAPVFVIAGALLWAAMARAGVEPALAGVVVGLVIPALEDERLEGALHPWSSFGALPVFVLANAGLHVSAHLLDRPGAARIAAGVVAGRLLGKLTGITLGAWLAVRLGLGELAGDTRWRHVAGAATMASVGFTVPLLFADAALPPALRDAATGALLAASVVGLGAGALWFAGRQRF